ncbi:MAG: energy-coupling factor transporter transmembrane component T [Candidatus Cloacimonas sp.]|jgi:energy-coupling factor transporter transmembrane protein EcfT|nr:energy-coupling factor transporter transmembrane component T [Candidatus Cloacimonas sp.]
MTKIQLHPLSHILICLVLSSLVFALSSLNRLCIVVLLSFVYSALRRAEADNASAWSLKTGFFLSLLTLKRSLSFIIPIAVLQVVFNRSGTTLWQFHILTITTGGLVWASILAIRLTTVILCAKALAVNSFQDFQATFVHLHLPEEFSFMLSYGVQLIPSFVAQFKGFIRSLHLRGIEPAKLSWRKRLQVYKLLAVSALAGIISGSTSAAIALELRGFRSIGKRSCLHRKSLGVWDAMVMIALIVGIIKILL